jgi:hypothetical protein
VLTGNGGDDVFKFAEAPWAHAEITDFSSGDQIDLSAMFARYGYTGTDPVVDGRIQITSDGSDGSQIWWNGNGLAGSGGSWELAALDHFGPSQLHVSGAFISG